MNCTQEVRASIRRQRKNQLIVASDLYRKKFSHIKEPTFYKIMERLASEEEIARLTTDIYCRLRETPFGKRRISDEEIAAHYMKNQNGMLIGYRMYNARGITTQVGKRIHVLSCLVKEKEKRIGNVIITRIGFKPQKAIVPIIEALEILQNYKLIEDINLYGLRFFMHAVSMSYSDDAATYALKGRRYKKATIAFLQSFLHYFHVSNTLDSFLSHLSDYKIPNVEALYESA